MKKFILSTGMSLLSILLISFGCKAQPPICDADGNLVIQESTFFDAFNSISDNQASQIGFSYNPTTEKHSLIIHVDGGGAVEFVLKKNGSDYFIKSNGTSITHSCYGSPCNSCHMSSTWFTTVKCTCNQTNCSECKCNHKVSKTVGAAAPNGDDLINALE